MCGPCPVELFEFCVLEQVGELCCDERWKMKTQMFTFWILWQSDKIPRTSLGQWKCPKGPEKEPKWRTACLFLGMSSWKFFSVFSYGSDDAKWNCPWRQSLQKKIQTHLTKSPFQPQNGDFQQKNDFHCLFQEWRLETFCVFMPYLPTTFLSKFHTDKWKRPWGLNFPIISGDDTKPWQSWRGRDFHQEQHTAKLKVLVFFWSK